VPHGVLLQDVAQRGAQARGNERGRALQAPVRRGGHGRHSHLHGALARNQLRTRARPPQLSAASVRRAAGLARRVAPRAARFLFLLLD